MVSSLSSAGQVIICRAPAGLEVFAQHEQRSPIVVAAQLVWHISLPAIPFNLAYALWIVLHAESGPAGTKNMAMLPDNPAAP